MKYIIKLILLLFLFSCDQGDDKSHEKKNLTEIDSAIIYYQELQAAKKKYKNKNHPKDSIPDELFNEIAKVDGKKINLYFGYYRGVYALNSNKDTVFNFKTAGDAEFLDFNQDGYKDIYIGYMTNVPDINDVALYDTVTKTFKLVKDLTNFPSPSKINGTNYYYSYHRSGCSDSNWGSDLFYIKDYKTYLIGTIEGYECESSEKKGVFVYQVNNERKKLIRSFYIKVIYKYEKYKWGFLEDYWTKNYHVFI
jgi:hypothetical protein